MQKNDALFVLDELMCSYSGLADEKVLYIKNLVIPKGKVVFLLGASGCGKSTLLETLGLMNNTMFGGSITLNNAGSTVELGGLWRNGTEDDLNRVRKKHYSFIFQNTNLMENFTAYENVCLSGMIKEDLLLDSARTQARGLMDKVKLGAGVVNDDTLAKYLSGGQRQRLAFVRALNGNATVLFGDEPTGNLDEVNASELMEIIRENLAPTNGREGLSAIIVSHDIDLAVKYADLIIVITKAAGNSYGEVEQKNVFERIPGGGWPVSDEEAFKKQLRGYYIGANEQEVHIPQGAKGRIYGDIKYKKLFENKEGQALNGKKNISLIVLSCIMFCTFLAMGFANGALNYLNEKMNSAFVNWITVEIPYSKSGSEKMSELQGIMDQQENKKKFLYSSVSPFAYASFFAWDSSRHGFFLVKSRSLDFERDSKLMAEAVFNKDNVVHGRPGGFVNPLDIGVVVTKQFLQNFGYPEDAKVVYSSKLVDDSSHTKSIEIKLPIEIRAIVNELPGEYDIAYLNHFAEAFVTANDPGFDITRNNNEARFFMETDDGTLAQKARGLMVDYFNKHPEYKNKYDQGEPYLDKDTLGWAGGYSISVDFLTQPPHNLLDSLENDVIAFVKQNGVKTPLVKYVKYNRVSSNHPPLVYDEFSVYFTRLDKVRPFKEFVYTTFNGQKDAGKINVDTNKVKEKENFNFLSNVTKIIAAVLLLFSIIATSLFLLSLLRGHLAKVQMNIGTFKAIGLGDKEATGFYFAIIAKFIAIAVLFGLSGAEIAGFVLDKIMSTFLSLESEISYFKLFDVKTLVALALIVLIGLGVSRSVISKMLNKTPGDLIYNR